MKINWLYFLLFCANLVGCSGITEEQLLGKWSASSLQTDSTTYFQEVESVILHIQPNNQYWFSGTLGYQEAGEYELKDSFLLLQSHPIEENPIILKIKSIQQDTLIIEMKNQQVLTLFQVSG